MFSGNLDERQKWSLFFPFEYMLQIEDYTRNRYKMDQKRDISLF